MGLALAKLGRHDQALTHYRRAQAIRPDYREAIPNLGNALKALGHWEEALAHYRLALEHSPDSPELPSVLVHLRQQLCDWDGLETAIQRVLAQLRGEHLEPPEEHHGILSKIKSAFH